MFVSDLDKSTQAISAAMCDFANISGCKVWQGGTSTLRGRASDGK